MTPAYTVLTWADAEQNQALLLNAVARAKAEYPDSKLGVGTGWSSPKTLHKSEALVALLDWMLEELVPNVPRDEFTHDAWANVLEPGDSIRQHDHRQAMTTGIYCVEGSGELVVGEEPVLLEPGRLVILDGRQPHHVLPVTAARTSVVVNVYG